MDAIVGDKLETKAGTAPTTSLSPKFWAIYFGAHWAPPCRKFTNDLKEFYTKVNEECKENQKNLEVIFVSLDGNLEHFDRNFGLMPWTALPYADEARVSALKVRYNISALPTLVVLDSTGNKTVSIDARKDVLTNEP